MIKQFDTVAVGAGPAGMAAALELSKHRVNAAIVDDADTPGGKIIDLSRRCSKKHLQGI